jgi:hypothetical protein
LDFGIHVIAEVGVMSPMIYSGCGFNPKTMKEKQMMNYVFESVFIRRGAAGHLMMFY